VTFNLAQTPVAKSRQYGAIFLKFKSDYWIFCLQIY